MENKIIKRQIKDKNLVIENLKRIPIVEVACNKSGVGRTTFYRWKKQDVDFSKQVDQAIDEGIKLINDMAESQLLTAIKEGDLKAVFYWLNHRHQAYLNKVELTGHLDHDYKLTKEQEELITKAIQMVTKGK